MNEKLKPMFQREFGPFATNKLFAHNPQVHEKIPTDTTHHFTDEAQQYDFQSRKPQVKD